MNVEALDHVNIITDKLDETAEFYGRLLGLVRKDAPPPLTPETAGILNRDTLSRLQPGGYLVNVARGAHLVEEDLIPLLDAGQLAGATLDVLRTEPPPADHPFWSDPRITLTPHTSARTLREETIAQIAGKIRALGRGEPIAGVVDRTRGY